MPQFAVINMRNEKVGEVDLPDRLFGVSMKAHLLHDTILQFLANRRSGTASTKNKAAVSGGGRKPWRQKGTGRARAGSIRSPLWVGGGTIFGPVPRIYSHRLPRKVRRYALRSALSERARANEILILESVEFERPSTKAFLGMLETLGLKGKILLVMKDPSEAVVRSARNIPGIRVSHVEGITTMDACRCDALILTRDALQALEENGKP